MQNGNNQLRAHFLISFGTNCFLSMPQSSTSVFCVFCVDSEFSNAGPQWFNSIFYLQSWSWFLHRHHANSSYLCFSYQQQLSQTTFKENDCRGFYSCHQTKICSQLLTGHLRKFPSIITALPMRFLHPPSPMKLQKIRVQDSKWQYSSCHYSNRSPTFEMLNIGQNLKSVNSFYRMAVLPVQDPSRKSTRPLGFAPFSFCARIAWLLFTSHKRRFSLY